MRDLDAIDVELSFLAEIYAMTLANGGKPTMIAIDLLLDERNAVSAEAVRMSESG